MNLFIFFVLPLVTILLAIVLQKVLKSPILVAITFFAIYLIIAFVSFSDTLAEAILATIIYTIISYITAYIVMIIGECRRRFCYDMSNNENNVEDTNCGTRLINDTVSLNENIDRISENQILNEGNITNNNPYAKKRCYRRW